MQLRSYQEAAITKTSEMLLKHNRVLITAATGSGKSIILSEISRRFISKSAQNRVLILCHSADILQQNDKTLKTIGVENFGIYCAKLGRKDKHNTIILASRDSLGRNPDICGKFSLCIIDECHLINPRPNSMYQKIFDAINLNYVVGLTGSPYRTDGGLIFGKGKFFDVQSCCISTAQLQAEGFLAHHVLPRLPALVDTSSVRVINGDYDTKELEKFVATEEVVRRAVAQWWKYASDRVCTIFFCCSVVHSKMVQNELKKYTQYVEHIDGEVKQDIREKLIKNARDGRVKAITNCAVFTTGVDIPPIDCVVFLRATQSTSLYIQTVGRGLRLSPETKKKNALILDMSGNWQRFDSIDSPLLIQSNFSAPTGDNENFVEDTLKKLGIEKKEIESVMKACPQCDEPNPAGKKTCLYCDHVFITHSANPFTQSLDMLKGGWKKSELSMALMQDYTSKKGSNCIKATLVLPQKTINIYLQKDGPFAFRHQKIFTFLSSSPKQILYRRGDSGFWEIQNINCNL